MIAGILYAFAVSIVFIPLFMITLSMKDPFPYPVGDPVFIGALLILASVVLGLPVITLTVYNRYSERLENYRMKHLESVLELRKIAIVGLLIGIALIIFALFYISFLFMIGYSIAIFILGLVGFMFIPPRYHVPKVDTKKSERNVP